MGLFKNYLQSTETVAKNLHLDDSKIIEIWNGYLITVKEKGIIIVNLTLENKDKNIPKLKQLLDIGLIDISKQEKLEEEIVIDLRKLQHDKNIQRVQRLEQCLGYEETRYEYIHKLIIYIYSILVSELKIIDSLKEQSQIEELKHLYDLELKIVEKIKNFRKVQRLETFNEVFVSLVRGEKIIKRMNDKERLLLKKMMPEMKKILTTNEDEQKNEGLFFEWTSEVFNSIENKIEEGIASGLFVGPNPDIDFEFVNKPEFVDLVKKKIGLLRKRKVSEEMIAVFVHIFREWFNHKD